jgi:hypothetical protein
MLGKLLTQASTTLETQPDGRTPEERAASVEQMKHIARRADFLARHIEGGQA